MSAARLREWADAQARAASSPAERERAHREVEFAELYSRHDRILREAGSLDGGDLVLEAARLLARSDDVRERVADRFEHVMADELEDVGVAGRELLMALAAPGNLVGACDESQSVRRFRGAGGATLAALRAAHPDAAEVRLDGSVRFGRAIELAASAVLGAAPRARARGRAGPGPPAADAQVRFWHCSSERAQAQAAAREIGRLLAAGEVRPESVGVIVGSGWREGRLVAGAFEERGVPFRFAGDAAFFGRPEVRDVLAWLRMLADPNDSAAVVRALTRPPVELRSVDLARVHHDRAPAQAGHDLGARGGAREPAASARGARPNPGLPQALPAAAGALEELRADVFVRRLIERVGLRRHRLFAASPETAERLVNLSRLAELAAAWCAARATGLDARLRPPPDGSRRRGRARPTTRRSPRWRPEAGPSCSPSPSRSRGWSSTTSICSASIEARSPGVRGSRTGFPTSWSKTSCRRSWRHAHHARRERLAHIAMSRASRALVVSWRRGGRRRSRLRPRRSTRRRGMHSADEERHDEELFGPAEGLQATYRMLRDEVPGGVVAGRLGPLARCASTPPTT